ncbi:hypothetical protein BKA81DRAFT_347219 [Phyllosticta paracitricarpa]
MTSSSWCSRAVILLSSAVMSSREWLAVSAFPVRPLDLRPMAMTSMIRSWTATAVRRSSRSLESCSTRYRSLLSSMDTGSWGPG